MQEIAGEDEVLEQKPVDKWDVKVYLNDGTQHSFRGIDTDTLNVIKAARNGGSLTVNNTYVWNREFESNGWTCYIREGSINVMEYREHVVHRRAPVMLV